MLENLPEETTQLLIDVCTSLAPLTVEADEHLAAPSRQGSAGAPSYLSLLALNRSPGTAAETAAPNPAPNPAPSQHPVSRQPSTAHEDPRSANATPPPMTPSSSNLPVTRVQTVKRPSPRLYFAHFIDDKDRFIHFLETVALKRWGQSIDAPVDTSVPTDPNEDVEAEKLDQAGVWNTLLELYLSYTSAEDPRTKAFADQAVRLLKSEHVPYDPTHALILCSTRNFTPGLVLLWERLGMYEDVLRFWMDKHREGTNPGASGEVIRCLNLYGSENPHLYPLVLRFLTSTPELLSKHTTDVTELLEHIDQENIMPPLAVVQVLSRNGVASIGLVKQWLMTRITQSREQIDTVSTRFWNPSLLIRQFSYLQDQKLIESYRMETQNKLKLVDDLSDPEHPKVFHVTQCTACKGQLDLPSVHFMCSHSYHQR